MTELIVPAHMVDAWNATAFELMYGDGSGRSLGLFANQRAPGDRSTHAGHMTRQRRRAEARAAAKATPRSKV